jgi:hypothetical protein
VFARKSSKLDIALILRDSWRITWKNGPLWALAVLMFVAFIPAGLLTMAFSTAANAVSLPGGDPMWAMVPGLDILQAQVRQVSPLAWVGIAVAGLLLLIATTSITLILQAASMRGVVIAAEQGRVGFGDSLRLGKGKATNIIKLSMVFGFITAFISIVPLLLLILIGDQSALGTGLIHFIQTGLSSISLPLNLLVLLVVMSIALEDFSPRAAFGRAGNVFRKGWWAFIMVIGLSMLSVVVTACIVIVPLFFAFPVILLNPEAGLWVTGTLLILSILGGLFFFLFTVVFTQTLYTFVYREAAKLASTTTSIN